MSNIELDIAIVGGGLVGASAALLCARANPHWRIAIIDPQPEPSEGGARPSFDARSSAISAGSVDCLRQLGCWSNLAEISGAIRQVHVSDRGYLPGQLLDAAEFQRDALGYVVPNLVLGQALLQTLNGESSVNTLRDQVENITFAADSAELGLASGDTLRAKLVVVADGAQSPTRQRLGIGTRDHDYGQCAVIANIRVSQPHRGVAYERFTETGPVAMLPLADARELALVWTLPPAQAELRQQGSDTEFLSALQAAFGHRLGRLQSVSQRISYPLQRREACEQVRSRLVLVGNAAHSLHPVAGQGFNLALRDCIQLASHLLAANVDDPGELAGLQVYQASRERDQRLTTALGDSMVRLFSRRHPVAVTLRHLGLLGLEAVPAIKHQFGRQMMGLANYAAAPGAVEHGGRRG